jgi:hypothetical protein
MTIAVVLKVSLAPRLAASNFVGGVQFQMLLGATIPSSGRGDRCAPGRVTDGVGAKLSVAAGAERGPNPGTGAELLGLYPYNPVTVPLALPGDMAAV